MFEGDEGFGVSIITEDRTSEYVALDDSSFDARRIGAINTDDGALTDE